MELSEIRSQIDDIDDQLKALFIKRMALTADVAEYKKRNGIAVTNSSREREIVARLSRGLDDTTASYLKILWNTLFDVSKANQNHILNANSELLGKINDAVAKTPKLMPKSAVIACQGVEGANSQLACDKLFARPEIMYVSTFEGVFNAVDQKLCAYGILPIENSLHGSVSDVYDLMKKYHFYIARSVRLRISHTLLARRGAYISSVREVYSHEQAIGQCSEFLKRMGDIKIIPCANTAVAAKYVAGSGRGDIAAIATSECAELYGLDILNREISNSDNNYTRFICISREPEIYPGSNRMSLMCTVPHKPGALYALLSKFAAHGINLLKLESRPIPGRDFEFMFYCDMDASVYSPEVMSLLCEFDNVNYPTVFLGSYSEI
ncbi:MAG: prephenate dehydratase domain-containing protein [Eubacteriales bacterium]